MASSSVSDSAGCRILTLSSSTQRAHEFVHRVKALANETTGNEDNVDESEVPWTIKNKYYTADVHFYVRDVDDLQPSLHASGVPAVIYVWSRGEVYKEQIKELSAQLVDHDPDVRLAVQLEPSPAITSEDLEHDDQLEEYLSEHGFEFVDGSHSSIVRAVDHPDDDSGAPGLYRVIDALSTIMWPSMVQSVSARKRRTIRVEDEADGLNALMSQAGADVPPPSAGSDIRYGAMAEEMAELERWLSDDVSGQEASKRKSLFGDSERADVDVGGDPWTSSSGPSSKGVSTPVVSFSGFDDDFTEFVGAEDASYRSLESVDEDSMHSNSIGGSREDDEGLPTRAEIKFTTERIFGAVSPESLDPDILPDEGAFDMETVLGALQGMKEEIAGISDEKERRRAAARVALGLVYGLQGEGGSEEWVGR